MHLEPWSVTQPNHLSKDGTVAASVLAEERSSKAIGGRSVRMQNES